MRLGKPLDSDGFEKAETTATRDKRQRFRARQYQPALSLEPGRRRLPNHVDHVDLADDPTSGNVYPCDIHGEQMPPQGTKVPSPCRFIRSRRCGNCQNLWQTTWARPRHHSVLKVSRGHLSARIGGVSRSLRLTAEGEEMQTNYLRSPSARLLIRGQKTINRVEFIVPTGLRTDPPAALNSNGS
jgi:hypothetical protein